jgi:hypothetical protein
MGLPTYLVTAHQDDNLVVMTREIYRRSASGATSMIGASMRGADYGSLSRDGRWAT